MFSFNRLGVIAGIGALAIAVLGLAASVMAEPTRTGQDNSGLLMSFLGL